MFSKKITDDDNFIMLSSSAQALYFHLSMQADDDGFCNQVNASMFKSHASVEDLKSLLERRYIYQFDDGVIVIKHWRMANALRKDRYTPTAFQEDFAKLDIKENGSYTLKGEWLPNGCQAVADRLPQVRIGKVSIDKDSNNIVHQDALEPVKPNFKDEFEEVWKMYPRKQGKNNALKSYVKARTLGVSRETIIQGIQDYIRYIKFEGIKPQYIKMGSTWFNQSCWDDDYTPTRKPTTKDIAPAIDFSDF